MTESGTTTVTRRELRLTGRDAQGPVGHSLRGAAPRRARHAVRHSRTTPLMSCGVLVLAAMLITGSVSHAHIQAARAAALHERVVATGVSLRAENAHQARSESASEARLASGAAGYAAGRRSAALVAARAAVEAGGVVVSTAAPVVSAQDLSPLDQAVAQLAVLIDAAPAPRVVMATATAELRPTTLPVGSAAVHDGRQEVSPVPVAVVAPLPAGAGTALQETAPAARSMPATAFTTPMGAATPVPPAVATAPTVETVPALPVAPAVPDVLDLALSAEIVAATTEVNALSAQVQAVAQANIAAAEAAARAAEERITAARRVAAEQARKVAVAKDASNGAIPTDSLCGLSFASDALVRCDAVASLEDLNHAFRAEFGESLSVDSSYRDFATQVVVKQARGGLAATAGTSNHGRALAIDLGGMGVVGQFDLPTYRWMKANAAEFGWYHPPYMEPGGVGPMEPWHWEFGKL